MPKYRKKPIVVEATRWFPGADVPGVHVDATIGDFPLHYVVTIHEQRAYLRPGDWVITESDGKHHYPCNPAEFARIYEPVSE